MKVSVLMITFKHEVFIRQAIESVLIQETNFNFELMVVNDCSPDRTDGIVRKIIKEHPKGHIINYIKHSKNIGMYANIMFALNRSQTEYIALCEGDDFWTDPLKLQKQVDFLEANPEYEVCFTNINIINEEGLIVKDQLIPNHRRTTYEQKHLPIWAPTLTRVFRNRNFQGVLPNVPALDTIMLLYQSKFGKIKCINEITGTYRMHGGGIYSSIDEAKKIEHTLFTLLASLKLVDKILLPRYFGMIFKKIIEIYPMDAVIFETSKTSLSENFSIYKNQMAGMYPNKIRLLSALISTSAVMKSKSARNVLMKATSKLLIYKIKA